MRFALLLYLLPSPFLPSFSSLPPPWLRPVSAPWTS